MFWCFRCLETACIGIIYQYLLWASARDFPPANGYRRGSTDVVMLGRARDTRLDYGCGFGQC